MVLANQRYVLAERHAQRKFLVHSLHSLNSLISDTFSSTSSNLDTWFTHIRRLVPNIVVISDSIIISFLKCNITCSYLWHFTKNVNMISTF